MLVKTKKGHWSSFRYKKMKKPFTPKFVCADRRLSCLFLAFFVLVSFLCYSSMMDDEVSVKLRNLFRRESENVVNALTGEEEKIQFEVCKLLKKGTNVPC